MLTTFVLIQNVFPIDKAIQGLSHPPKKYALGDVSSVMSVHLICS